VPRFRISMTGNRDEHHNSLRGYPAGAPTAGDLLGFAGIGR